MKQSNTFHKVHKLNVMERKKKVVKKHALLPHQLKDQTCNSLFLLKVEFMLN